MDDSYTAFSCYGSIQKQVRAAEITSTSSPNSISPFTENENTVGYVMGLTMHRAPFTMRIYPVDRGYNPPSHPCINLGGRFGESSLPVA